VRTQTGLNALLRDQFTVDVRPGLRSPIWAWASRARLIWGVPTLSCGAYSGVALNGSIHRPKSSGDRAYHERRLTTREIAFGAVSRRRRRRHSAANWRAWAEVAGPGWGVVIARLVLADGQ
jgi:hypothetical protein